MSAEIPLSVMIGEVENEIKMREHVFGGWVARGKMKRDVADRRIRIMQEVLATLQRLREGGDH